MKLTATQLRRIIKEEVQKVMEASQVPTVGDTLKAAGLDTRKFRDYLNVPVNRISLNNGAFYAWDYKDMNDIPITREESDTLYAGLVAHLPKSKTASSGTMDVSGPEVEMVSGRSSFMIELGDDAKEAVKLFKRAAVWCSRVKGSIDYSAANSIEIGTEEDSVTVNFVPDPKAMAASFNAAADFISQNASEYIHVDID